MPESTKSDAHINAPSELAAAGNPYTNFRGARRDRDFRNWPPLGGHGRRPRRRLIGSDATDYNLQWSSESGPMGCIEVALRRAVSLPRTSRAKDASSVKFGLDGQPAISSADGLYCKQCWDEPEKKRADGGQMESAACRQQRRSLQPSAIAKCRKINPRRGIPSSRAIAGAKFQSDFLVSIGNPQWRACDRIWLSRSHRGGAGVSLALPRPLPRRRRLRRN